jgi:ABC-type multidrug transport system ATPase subunit
MNEAKYCSRIGFVRNGEMLVEDSPINIQRNLNTNEIDNALLMLCEGESYEENNEIEKVIHDSNDVKYFDSPVSSYRFQRFRALVTQELIFIRTRLS